MDKWVDLNEHLGQCPSCALALDGPAEAAWYPNRILTALRRERNARTGGESRIMRAFHYIVTGEEL